jgi:hypothetical protein
MQIALAQSPRAIRDARETPMDQRIESFLGDVLALAGEESDAGPRGVRVALADSEAIFRAQEPNKRMRDQAARVSRALCRSRVVAEMHQRAAKLLTRDEARRSGGLCGVGFSTGRSALRSTMPR